MVLSLARLKQPIVKAELINEIASLWMHSFVLPSVGLFRVKLYIEVGIGELGQLLLERLPLALCRRVDERHCEVGHVVVERDHVLGQL